VNLYNNNLLFMLKMPSWPKPLGNRLIDFDLSRIQQLLENLDNPQYRIPPVIHIAGTNGKGSTLAFLTAIFEAAKYQVHRYTSPHLINFNERIYTAGHNISDNLLEDVAQKCKSVADNIDVTFFEGTTAMAFLAFSMVEADVVLLETGMGGRLDATNVIEKPLLTAITPISYDHMEYLGNTLPEIAAEKAGIFKHNVPCVVSYQEEIVMQELENKACDVGVPLFRYGHEWQVQKLSDAMAYMEEDSSLRLPTPSLFGPHQYLNAGHAVACIECVKDQFNITNQHIATGISNATWPGRMEQITKGNLNKLLPENWELWIDGAHNQSGSQMLSMIADDWSDKELLIITGITKGRDCQQFFLPLKNKIKHICTIKVESEPSAYPAIFISEKLNAIGFSAEPADDLDQAMNIFIQKTKKPARILICGSLYLAADVKSYG
ncbi:MAG: folylpolyglutamate synthase/dihydrofolate synthase family protein, partial [Pseudomonadota bacterium]